MTASKKCKQHGFNLKELSEQTGVSVQTLTNWFNYKPKLFEIVVIGAREEKERWKRENC